MLGLMAETNLRTEKYIEHDRPAPTIVSIPDTAAFYFPRGST